VSPTTHHAVKISPNRQTLEISLDFATYPPWTHNQENVDDGSLQNFKEFTLPPAIDTYRDTVSDVKLLVTFPYREDESEELSYRQTTLIRGVVWLLATFEGLTKLNVTFVCPSEWDVTNSQLTNGCFLYQIRREIWELNIRAGEEEEVKLTKGSKFEVHLLQMYVLMGMKGNEWIRRFSLGFIKSWVQGSFHMPVEESRSSQSSESSSSAQLP
jgi:hypothetical protein